MKRSLRELSIDVVIHMGIFKNNLITLFSCFTFIPEIEVRFYSVAVDLLTLIRLRFYVPCAALCRFAWRG